MARYVALLRGINVGGKNVIKMTALKDCFEDQVFALDLTGDPASYSGAGTVVRHLVESIAANAARPPPPPDQGA
jgi:hypothetical protein